jgi:hypothetical protein
MILIDVRKKVNGVVDIFTKVEEFGLPLFDLRVIRLRDEIECLVKFVFDH